MHMTTEVKRQIIDGYTKELLSTGILSKKYGYTRSAIKRMLNKSGVDTSKKIGNTRIPVSCSACGSELTRHRSRMRNQINHFCNIDCYYLFLQAGNDNGEYIQNRHAQRLARLAISKVYDLKEGNVVHHIDRNCMNNSIYNLMVFKNQGDHIRFHRLGRDYATPVFDGSTI